MVADLDVDGTPAALRTPLPIGASASVRVPASTANLGAGFDCLGLALGLYDHVSVEVAAADVVVEASGCGADQVPRDGRHLVARAVAAGLAASGAAAPGLRLTCRNSIPHSRGLGSSASAAVAGVIASQRLVAVTGVGTPLTTDEIVQLAGEFEGHPDNSSASVLGGAIVSWTEGGRYFARRIDVHPAVRATAFVPDHESSTEHTRGLLPDVVPRCDAVFNLSRAALAVHAVCNEPELLFAATEDRLHQSYRAEALPETTALVAALRSRGVAAAVSGAGPTVLALTVDRTGAGLDPAFGSLAAEHGFDVLPLDVAGPASAY